MTVYIILGLILLLLSAKLVLVKQQNDEIKIMKEMDENSYENRIKVQPIIYS